MSHVTNIILSHSIMEDEDEVLGRLNRWLAPQRLGQFVDTTDYRREAVGGGKAFEQPTYLAAFNHLDLEAFLDVVRSIPWQDPNMVQVLVCGEEDDVFWCALGPMVHKRWVEMVDPYGVPHGDWVEAVSIESANGGMPHLVEKKECARAGGDAIGRVAGNTA